MFNLESYVKPILLSYVEKYVRDFNPVNAQVHFWNGDVGLHNLVLKPDVLQREVALPFTLVSGRIHELFIKVPWTKMMSEPIVVTINTIECVLAINSPNSNENPPEQPRNQLVAAPPGYMQALVRRIVNNISVNINSLIVKYVHDDIVVSLNVKQILIDSTDGEWKPSFVDLDFNDPIVRRLVCLDDFTLCMDRSDSDGKIRHFQEPLLDRCKLEIRVMTNLLSANSRKATNLTVQIRSSDLELSFSSDQLNLLVKILQEIPQPVPLRPTVVQIPSNNPPVAGPSRLSVEAPRKETWSEWAWSWMPSWSERADIDVADTPPGEPFPILITAFVEKLGIVYKVMETEMGSHFRRARSLLELSAEHVALMHLSCAPKLLRFRLGMRALRLASMGKCACGHLDINALEDKPTIYLEGNYTIQPNYSWPEATLKSFNVQRAMAAEKDSEHYPNIQDSAMEEDADATDEAPAGGDFSGDPANDLNQIWFHMSPFLFVQVERDRKPPPDKSISCDPYDNPPTDFEYSDWVEAVKVRVSLRPVALAATTGLLHRLELVQELVQDLPPTAQTELPVRPLTVEECEALVENIPVCHVDVRLLGLALRLTPWDHSLEDQPALPLATVELALNKIWLEVVRPLYPNRVCLAACHIPDASNPIRDAARKRFDLKVLSATGHLSAPTNRLSRPLFKGSLNFTGKYLLNKDLFKDPETVNLDGNLEVKEMTICVSAAALNTTVEVLHSLFTDRPSALLKDSTLAEDAMNDRDTTAVEGIFSGVSFNPTLCHNVKMASLKANTVKITGIELKNGTEENVAWVFSAPESEFNTEPWLQIKAQLCDDKSRSEALDYFRVQAGSAALSLDPLLVKWISYRPRIISNTRPMSKSSSVKSMSSSKYFIRRYPTSSGRSSRMPVYPELVHGRSRSAESGSERRDAPRQLQRKIRLQEKLWENETLLDLYNRMRRTLVSVDVGPVLLYSAASVVSALETNSIQEAMERHAEKLQRVLIISLGHWTLTTDADHLWERINDERPTILNVRLDHSFPWCAKISGMSLKASSHSVSAGRVVTSSLVEPFDSSVTVLVVTRAVGSPAPKQPKTTHPPPTTKDDEKKRYFTSGVDFIPKSLSEYIRGPRARPGPAEEGNETAEGAPTPAPAAASSARGHPLAPLESLGVHVHGETPPLVIRLRQDQVRAIRATLHYLSHILELIRKPNTPVQRKISDDRRPESAPPMWSFYEASSTAETESENPSEQLIPIFQTESAMGALKKLKTSIYFQWVINRASISFVTKESKLSLEIEDTITTLDLKETHQQFHLKIMSAAVYHYNPKEDGTGWEAGACGAHVLEMRDVAERMPHLLLLTLTRASSHNLPPNWKEDVLQHSARQNINESTWEVALKMAPLDITLSPDVLEEVTVVGKSLMLRSFCPLLLDRKSSPLTMPFCHFDLGGMRIILNAGEVKNSQDDTLVFNIGHITTLPKPDNPIYRWTIDSIGEINWIPAGCEGRQHDLMVNELGLRSVRMSELLAQANEIRSRSERTVNPAAKWVKPVPEVDMSTILHEVGVHGIVAAPIYINDKLISGPSVELNVAREVTVELNVEQVALLAHALPALRRALVRGLHRGESMSSAMEVPTWCPFSQYYVVDQEDLLGDDSGVESRPSTSREDIPPKKSVSIAAAHEAGPFDYVELIMVLDTVNFSLYVRNRSESKVTIEPTTSTGSPNITEEGEARHSPMQSLLQVTLQQPNMYYWWKKEIKGLQISLFDARVTAGDPQVALFLAKRGLPDPDTGIPPSLASIRCRTHTSCVSSDSGRDTWSVQVDIERPIYFLFSNENLNRLRSVVTLFNRVFNAVETPTPMNLTERTPSSMGGFYKKLMDKGLATVELRTSQIAVESNNVKIGFEEISAQVSVARRPEQVCARALLTGATVTTRQDSDSSDEPSHVALLPLMIGVQLEVAWQPKRTSECAPHEPQVQAAIDVDTLTLNLRPADFNTFDNAIRNIKTCFDVQENANHDNNKDEKSNKDSPEAPSTSERPIKVSVDTSDGLGMNADVYYKDDLGSGAFKLKTDCEAQMPMAYEVSMHASTVVWHYPMPRCITRIVAHPVPTCNREVECVLESFNHLLNRWEANAFFQIPVLETRDYSLTRSHSDKVFASLWRVRPLLKEVRKPEPVMFVPQKFRPHEDPVVRFSMPSEEWAPLGAVMAEQLLGALRIDSYFTAQYTPRVRLAVTCGTVALSLNVQHPHCDDEFQAGMDVNILESVFGYREGTPQTLKLHRLATLLVRNAVINVTRSQAHQMLSCEAQVGVDIYESETGRMEPLIADFVVQGVVVKATQLQVRATAGDICVYMNLPRLRTLNAILDEWIEVFKLLVKTQTESYAEQSCARADQPDPESESWLAAQARLFAALARLDGCVCLFVANTCDVPLWFGQEGTEEAVLIHSGVTLPYRWDSPMAPKKLRFAIATSSSDFRWSKSVHFATGRKDILLEELADGKHQSSVTLDVRVEDLDGRKTMYLGGKILLGNMLRHKLIYRVRVRGNTSEADGTRLVSAGEIPAESVGRTVLHAADVKHAFIKIKFASPSGHGWSGDIPLKESTKKYFPWIVKVPSATDGLSCVRVWCRVESTAADSCVSVLFWPQFVVRSHLPLDLSVSITTNEMDGEEATSPPAPVSPPASGRGHVTLTPSEPLTQPASGRGHVTHLLTQACANAKYSLKLNYAISECQVTRGEVPLHYYMAEKPVFASYSQPSTAREIAEDALRWLDKNCAESTDNWPYSPVRTHWPRQWQAAAIQPRCDVLVRYHGVHCCGNGCGLIVHLLPRALLANASDVAVTLRGSDASPLCRLDPGTVIAPPATIVESPFFVTVENGRETYVSNELCVSREEPGVYGTLPAGRLAPDRTTDFAIHCNKEVFLMTMHYNLHMNINVFGITSSFLFLNKLDHDICISPMVVEYSSISPPTLQPQHFELVKPTPDGLKHGTRLTRFHLSGRWAGGEVSSLRAFLCIAIPDEGNDTASPAAPAVPVRIGIAPMRRAIAPRDGRGESIPVVVTQVKHEGRWVVSVARDPMPQYVVRNLSREPLALAQPLQPRYETGEVEVYTDCKDAKWWFVCEPQQWSYYSSSVHLSLHAPGPQSSDAPDGPRVAYLCVGRLFEDTSPRWSAPFAVKDGEKFVPLTSESNIKVRVRTFPHSTSIELLEVDEDDLSASEIRRRLAHRDTLPVPENPPLLDRIRSNSKQLDTLEPQQSDNIEEPAPTSSVLRIPVEDSSNPGSADSLPQSDIEASMPPQNDWMRLVVRSLVVEVSHSCHDAPLVRAHFERLAFNVQTDITAQTQEAALSIGDIQIDNAQHASGQFDFPVVASTSDQRRAGEPFPPLWGMLLADEHFDGRIQGSNLVLRSTHARWTVAGRSNDELLDVDLVVGPMSLYVEDSYVKCVTQLARALAPSPPSHGERAALAEARALLRPLCLRRLHVHPLDLTLTLRTSAFLYIAVDRSPLRHSAFKIENTVTTLDRLFHKITAHYLSATILAAGWMVSGLELLGAPGSLAARLTSAQGGVRGVASTTGAALLRSFNACADSLARNLDLLAGDDEHTQRAARARREYPPTLMAGVGTGLQNFGVNMLGAVGGLMHHPVVGVAVGETSATTALRRGLLGALAKPLSGTADLAAFAGQGLLHQTGWDPNPQQRVVVPVDSSSAWRRDCVRWAQRVLPLVVLHGVDSTCYDVGGDARFIVTDQFLMVVNPRSERTIEKLELRRCRLRSYDEGMVEILVILQSSEEVTGDDEATDRVSSEVMARVAKYTGARAPGTERVLSVRTAPHSAPALAAALAFAIRHSMSPDTHVPLLTG